MQVLKDRMYLQLVRYLLLLIMPLNKQIIDISFILENVGMSVCCVCVSMHVNVAIAHNT